MPCVGGAWAILTRAMRTFDAFRLCGLTFLVAVSWGCPSGPSAVLHVPSEVDVGEWFLVDGRESSKVDRFAWEFGNHEPRRITTSGLMTYHYSSAGLYEVRLVVTDMLGNEDVAVAQVNVIERGVTVPDGGDPHGDGGWLGDGGTWVDGGLATDGGVQSDAGMHGDGGSSWSDASVFGDGGYQGDAGHPRDAGGWHPDASVGRDGGSVRDASVAGDAGSAWCTPEHTRVCSCPRNTTGVSVCGPNGLWGTCLCSSTVDPGNDAAFLQLITEAMVGQWKGSRTTFWDGRKDVEERFSAQGGYSARCLAGDCTAYYWGIDEDHPNKTWRLVDVHTNREISGTLNVAFSSSLSDTQTGAIRALTMSADLQQLRYQFWNTWSGSSVGPVTFTLTRVND